MAPEHEKGQPYMARDDAQFAPSPSMPGAALSESGDGPAMGDVFAGRYRIIRSLGVGSLCSTFVCADESDGGREKVLKLLLARKASDAHLAESFVFLAESVSRYRHPGIAPVLETGIHLGSPYYTLPYISGKPLRMWLLENLEFDQRVVPGLELVKRLAEIFAAIHELGCYGCLKPENVFLTANGPVVTDFGVVGFLTPQEFEFNAYARRYLPYMAPELRQDWSNLVPESDIYSLGAITYEILAGRPPSATLILPSQFSNRFGWEMDEFILKALAVNPEKRFHSASALARALDGVGEALDVALNSRPVPVGEATEKSLPPMSEDVAGTETIWGMVDEKPRENPEAAEPMSLSDADSAPEPALSVESTFDFRVDEWNHSPPASTPNYTPYSSLHTSEETDAPVPPWLTAILILGGIALVGASLLLGLLSMP